MKNVAALAALAAASLALAACPQAPLTGTVNVIYLHHSTGANVWGGGVPEAVAAYNADRGTDYRIEERAYPKDSPYGWNNYPYDYWNIWVNHAGPAQYEQEDTLEILTQGYQVVVFKHCFPVSDIGPDSGAPDVGSSDKTLENYKLQYAALKAKMRSFPNARFIVWTGAARNADADAAQRARSKQFFDWVVNEWDEPNDNIFVWDFFRLETGGGDTILPAYDTGDSHPNADFCAMAAPCFAKRLADVIEGYGDLRDITGR